MVTVANMDVRQHTCCGQVLNLGDNEVEDEKWDEMMGRRYISSRVASKKLIIDTPATKKEKSSKKSSKTTGGPVSPTY